MLAAADKDKAKGTQGSQALRHTRATAPIQAPILPQRLRRLKAAAEDRGGAVARRPGSPRHRHNLRERAVAATLD